MLSVIAHFIRAFDIYEVQYKFAQDRQALHFARIGGMPSSFHWDQEIYMLKWFHQ